MYNYSMQRSTNDGAADTVTRLTHMGELEDGTSVRLHREQDRVQREKASQETMPDWAVNDEGDWKGMLYGLALAIGGTALIVGVLRWVL